MILSDGAVFCILLVIFILVREGRMDSIEREQGNHKVKGTKDKVALHIMRGKRDYMDYEDLRSQVFIYGSKI